MSLCDDLRYRFIWVSLFQSPVPRVQLKSCEQMSLYLMELKVVVCCRKTGVTTSSTKLACSHQGPLLFFVFSLRGAVLLASSQLTGAPGKGHSSFTPPSPYLCTNAAFLQKKLNTVHFLTGRQKKLSKYACPTLAFRKK